MYKCENCNEAFTEIEYESCLHMEKDNGDRGTICSNCGSDEGFREVNSCFYCGEPTEDEYEDFCEECISDSLGQIKESIMEIAGNYGMDYDDLVNNFYEEG